MKKSIQLTCFLFASIVMLSVIFLQTMPVGHATSQLMDYFTATPIIGSLSSTCWGAAQIGPRDQSNGLEDKTMAQWTYWDGNIIKGTDGIYHMFAARWNQAVGFGGWMSDSHCVHATSTNLYGPYTDQGLAFTDNNGMGHNVGVLQLKPGDSTGKQYAITLSGGVAGSGRVYGANSLNGPWTYLGNVSVASGSSYHTYGNMQIILRPDGKYEAIDSAGIVALSDNLLGPYTDQGPSIYTNITGIPDKGRIEDPTIWYSGGKYHWITNQWDSRKAYHLTSPDGIKNWQLEPGLAYDPTANFVRYTNGTVNHWYQMERPRPYLENGHVVAFTFASINVQKETVSVLGSAGNGSKVVVVPFDGAAFDSAPTPTPVIRSAFSQIEAESYDGKSGSVRAEACGEGGQNLGYINTGDYVVYNNVDFGAGASSFQARVASTVTSGRIYIRLDSPSGTLIGTLTGPNTGGSQTYTTATCTVSGVTGVHNLYLVFDAWLNLNWFKFTPANGNPTPTATPTPTSGQTPTPTTRSSYVRFRNVATSLYIDGMGSTGNGSNCCQWGNSGSNNQQWTIITSGSYVMIQNRATGLYMDGMGRTSNGSICGLWGYSASNAQQWTQETAGSYVKFKNRQTGLYLDGMGSTSNDSNLCQWSSSSSTNQQWQIQ